jgi:hypothetical protein
VSDGTSNGGSGSALLAAGSYSGAVALYSAHDAVLVDLLAQPRGGVTQVGVYVSECE